MNKSRRILLKLAASVSLLGNISSAKALTNGTAQSAIPSGSTSTTSNTTNNSLVVDDTKQSQTLNGSQTITGVTTEQDVAEQIKMLMSANGGVFHVESFGAVGDSKGTPGSGTDDTAAFIAAFAAANVDGGGKVIASGSKTYRISHTIFYGSRTIFDGQGCEIFHDSNTANGSAFQPLTFQSYTDFTTDVLFANFILSGPINRGNGISANRASRITLFNVGSHYLHWHIFDGAGAQQFKIINCWSEGTRTAAFQIDVASYPNASEASDAAGNILPISYDGKGSETWSFSKDVLIDGCTIKNAGICGIHIHNTGNRNVRITNNYIEHCEAGILADDVKTNLTFNTQIHNNTIIACKVSVSWKGGYESLSITGNNFYGNNEDDNYYGILILPRGQTQTSLAINGNAFKGIIRPIVLNGAVGFSISDNIFDYCGGKTAVSSAELVSKENPMSILRASGCQSGKIFGNVFDDCVAPVCVSVAKNEIDETSCSTSIIFSENISKNSGCLYSLYYADRCVVTASQYISSEKDSFGMYANTCSGLQVDGMYVSQGAGNGIYFDNCVNAVLRNSTLFSTGSGLAVTFNNCAFVKTSDTIVTGGYNKNHINLSGNTNAICDEPFAIIKKTTTASGVKVVYNYVDV